MARLGGGSSTPATSTAPPASAEDQERDDDGRELYEVLADQVAAMSIGEQMALGQALQRNDWRAISDDQRELFRLAAEEFLSEGGA